jgi:hypothetical protein
MYNEANKNARQGIGTRGLSSMAGSGLSLRKMPTCLTPKSLYYPWECSMNIALVVAVIVIGIPLVIFGICGIFACIRSSQISRDEERLSRDEERRGS